MSWAERVRSEVVLRARRRLVRELCRALASGLSVHDVIELLAVAKRAVDDEREATR